MYGGTDRVVNHRGTTRHLEIVFGRGSQTVNVLEFVEKWRRVELTELHSTSQQLLLAVCDLIDYDKLPEIDPQG